VEDSVRCERCKGLVVDEPWDLRCVNCGHRPGVIAMPVRCKFSGCQHIPSHGTICSEHMSKLEKQRRELIERLTKARALRWKKEST
jgi:hypothetical protein